MVGGGVPSFLDVPRRGTGSSSGAPRRRGAPAHPASTCCGAVARSCCAAAPLWLGREPRRASLSGTQLVLHPQPAGPPARRREDRILDGARDPPPAPPPPP